MENSEKNTQSLFQIVNAPDCQTDEDRYYKAQELTCEGCKYQKIHEQFHKGRGGCLEITVDELTVTEGSAFEKIIISDPLIAENQYLIDEILVHLRTIDDRSQKITQLLENLK